MGGGGIEGPNAALLGLQSNKMGFMIRNATRIDCSPERSCLGDEADPVSDFFNYGDDSLARERPQLCDLRAGRGTDVEA